jgi:hypothetical protein
MDDAAGRRVAAVRRAGRLLAASALLVGCGKLQGFGGPAPPLVSFDVAFSGDLAPLRPPGDTAEHALRLALVWGAQWLTEPFCILPAESDAAAAVIGAGCRDPFGFVPLVVFANVPMTSGQATSLTLAELPSADVLVGDVTSRVAYGSLVVYDDRNDNGTLDIATPHRTARGGDGPPQDDTADSPDLIYGASFHTMTAPDQRVAYLEGLFDPKSAFYPRAGCQGPPGGFSVLAAGGFSDAAGRASGASMQLPLEDDPTTCSASPASATEVRIVAQAPSAIEEVGCAEGTSDSSTRYREPPANEPNLTDRKWACVHLPTFDTGTPSALIQLVVTGRATDRCKGLTHYTLRGCRESVTCPVPDWDYSAAPPAWWKCAQ